MNYNSYINNVLIIASSVVLRVLIFYLKRIVVTVDKHFFIFKTV